jgi:PAS domain S-box-containing protein
LFVLIVLAIITANLISVTVATAGWPLSTGTSLLIHSALTVALLFAGLYLFAIGPLAMRIRELEMRTRELELKKEELQRLKAEVEKQLQQRTSELAEATQKIETANNARKQVEGDLQRLLQELDQRVAERTSKLENSNRDLQSQIADQRKAGEVLRESEKRYRRLVEIAREGIWTINAQGKTNFVNRRGAELLGYSIPEMLGHAPSEFVFTEDLPRDIQSFDLQRSNAPNPIQFRMRRKGGQELWVRSTLAPIVGDRGEYLGALILFGDISAQKRSEQRLQEHVSLLDTAQDAFLLCDANLHILAWNQGATRLYGWAADEVLGRNFLELTENKSSPPPKDELLNRLQSQGAWRGELNQLAKDGRRLVADLRLNVTESGPGKPQTVLLLATDITESKRRESQLLREQRIESASNLATGLAQELNNMLAPVLLSAQMLRSRRLEKDDADLAATIEASAERSAELLRQALIFARGVEGERVVIQPARLVKDITEIARETFPRNIQILSDVPADIWNIRGDSTQLHQILLKLCVHARDAMPSGGVLRIKVKNVPLDPTAANAKPGLKPGPHVALEIQDSSAPLPEAAQDRVFEPFFNPKEGHRGMGLGLSMALGIVRSHGGSISLRNVPGGGNAFEILLPAIAEAPVEPKAAPVERPAGRGEVILMVEDEAALRDVTQKTLSRYGYEVMAASDGVEALGLLAQHQGRIRLVLTNMMTPSMDGTALARAARRIDPHLRIIASSGLGRSLGQAERLAALQSLGINRVLAKPYTADELLRAIRDELGGVSPGKG